MRATPSMRELNVAEQWYEAVIGDRLSISQVAKKVGDRPHRPRHCPHQMDAQVKAVL